MIDSYLLTDIGSSDGAATAAIVKKAGHVAQSNGTDVPIEISPARPWKRYVTLPFTAAEFEAGTRWAGPFGRHEAPPLSLEPSTDVCCRSRHRADIARFSAPNGVEMEISGAKGTWRLVDGAIELDLPDSSYRYRRLARGLDGDEHWLMEQWVAGELLAAYDIPATRAEQVAIDATQLARVWQSNHATLFRELKYYSLMAGGKGVRASTPYSDSVAPDLQFTLSRSTSMYWELLTNGQVRMATGEFIPAGGGFSGCAPFGPAPTSGTCLTTNPRQWRIVARRGQTLFVLESSDVSSGAQILIALRDKGPAPN